MKAMNDIFTTIGIIVVIWCLAWIFIWFLQTMREFGKMKHIVLENDIYSQMDNLKLEVQNLKYDVSYLNQRIKELTMPK